MLPNHRARHLQTHVSHRKPVLHLPHSIDPATLEPYGRRVGEATQKKSNKLPKKSWQRNPTCKQWLVLDDSFCQPAITKLRPHRPTAYIHAKYISAWPTGKHRQGGWFHWSFGPIPPCPHHCIHGNTLDCSSGQIALQGVQADAAWGAHGTWSHAWIERDPPAHSTMPWRSSKIFWTHQRSQEGRGAHGAVEAAPLRPEHPCKLPASWRKRRGNPDIKSWDPGFAQKGEFNAFDPGCLFF